MTALRDLPSVDQLLSQGGDLVAAYGHPLSVAALRAVLQDARALKRTAPDSSLPTPQEVLAQAQAKLEAWTAPTLIPVINASGVIIHTNLGRAPLSTASVAAMRSVSLGYSNLEYDLAKGQRGSRLLHAEKLLCRLTGCEAALVVNNNASAIMLVLGALSKGKRAVIARSQLVEIGGGFRVPDVMKQSGARLAEIGTTNRVNLGDYTEALAEPAGLVMRAHRSNFKIVGFTEEPGLAEIAALAHQSGVPVMDDLGSGALLDTARYGLAHEPTVGESLAAGADVVCFSGDKLLGGPQAGLILGRAELLARIRVHPLARAVRADKVALAGISATLLHYLKDEAVREIPVWRMIAASLPELEARARGWKEQLGTGEVVESSSTVGGGSLPGESMPTRALALTVKSPHRFLARLRAADPPVVARTEAERALVDPRTVLPEQDGLLLQVLEASLANEAYSPGPEPKKPRSVRKLHL